MTANSLLGRLALGLCLGACSSGDSTAEPSADTASTETAADGTSTDTAAPVEASDSGTADTSGATDTTLATDAPVDTGPVTYVVESRTIASSGDKRAYTLARPPVSKDAQLVIAFHGDGGNGPSFRTSLTLEPNASRPTVFVYPTAAGGTFGYWDDAGRTKEAQFVGDVIAALRTELGIDDKRVFLAGFSGGATLSNALACRLGPTVIRAVGIHSGTLYPVTTSGGKKDFDYDGKGAPTCALPPAILVWGALDKGDTSFTYGQNTRDGYVAKNTCASTTKPAAWTPCVAYDACAVTWCPIDGMGHSLWSGAAKAMQQYFDAR